MTRPATQAQVMAYLEKHPNRKVFLADIVRATHLTEKQVQAACYNLTRREEMQVVVRGQAWQWNSKTPILKADAQAQEPAEVKLAVDPPSASTTPPRTSAVDALQNIGARVRQAVGVPDAAGIDQTTVFTFVGWAGDGALLRSETDRQIWIATPLTADSFKRR